MKSEQVQNPEHVGSVQEQASYEPLSSFDSLPTHVVEGNEGKGGFFHHGS